MNAEHPAQVLGSGVVLSPAETDRLGAVLGSAGRTLAAAAEQLPAGQQQLCQQLEQAASDLTRRMLRAERASVRLDAPVRLDAEHSGRLLGLLERAVARLEEVVARREARLYLVGPDYFRGQAGAARAWHADLGELAVRQADRCQPEPERSRDRDQPQREADGAR